MTDHQVRNIGLIMATGAFVVAAVFFLQLGPFAKGVSTTSTNSTSTSTSGSTFTSQVCPWYGFNCTIGTYSMSGSATVSISASTSTSGSVFTSKSSCGNPFGLFC